MEEDCYINSLYEYKDIINNSNLFKIYKAFDKKNKNYVAVKIIEKSNLLIFNQIENIKISKKIRNEIYSLKNLDSNYFIKLIDFRESKNNFYIITELSNINLEEYIHKNNKDLTIEQIRNIFNKLNIGFNELINCKMFYYNIKLNNILITFNEENNNINNIIPKMNLFGLNNLLRTCHNISLIKKESKYLLKKNNDFNIKTESFFIEKIGNLLYSINSLRKDNRKINEETEDINNIINFCNSKISNDKLNLLN
jgi:serine/threonine protein kinase